MNRITLIVVVTEVVLAVVGLVGGRWLGTPILEDARVDLRSWGLALTATLPPVALVSWGMRTKRPFFARMRRTFSDTLVPLFAGCSLLEVVLISIMAGIGEEVFFRAFLQGSLGQVVDPWMALLLASALFGAVHYVSLGYAIFAGVLGGYLGMLWLLTGNLFVAVAVHALFDFVAIALMSRLTLSPTVEADPPRR